MMRTTILPMPPARWLRLALAGVAGAAVVLVLAIVSLVASIVSGCTPADRAFAGRVVSAAAPFACAGISAVLDRSGVDAQAVTFVGTFCPDAAGLVSRALLAMPAAAPPTVRPVSSPEPASLVLSCADGSEPEPLGLPDRDPRERVCPAYRAQVLRALGIGHAR